MPELIEPSLDIRGSPSPLLATESGRTCTVLSRGTEDEESKDITLATIGPLLMPWPLEIEWVGLTVVATGDGLLLSSGISPEGECHFPSYDDT